MEISPYPTDLHWSSSRKLGFRFLFLYFFLYLFPFPLGNLPWIDITATWVQNGWNLLVPWVGKTVLGIEEPINTVFNGSGDRTFDYVQVFTFFFLALIGSTIWTLADRRRINYERLNQTLWIYVRYGLAISVMGYGFAKIFKTQFPEPGFFRLLESYGDSSPMGLAWTFMGYSKAYNYFTGIAELLAGLMLFRKTSSLGALITIAVMTNVVMMNFSFDIPVKLYSAHLLLMAIYVLSPDFQRIWNFFTHREVNVPERQFLIWPEKYNTARLVIKTLFIGYIFYSSVDQGLEIQKQWGDKAPKPDMYGLYQVEHFVLNGDTLPSLTSDTIRWQHLVIQWEGRTHIQMMNDKFSHYSLEKDSSEQKLTIFSRRDTVNKNYFTYDFVEGESLDLQGTWGKDTLSVEMIRRTKDDFLLLNRGFNWINEFPFNR